MGWLGLAIPEAQGGEGAGLTELAIVVEELGRQVSPGPFLPTVIASAVIDRTGETAARGELLPGLADGSRVGAIGFDGTLARKGGVVSGDAGLVLGAGTADLLLLASGKDIVIVDRDQEGVRIEP